MSTYTPGPWRIGGGNMRAHHERKVIRGANLEYVARVEGARGTADAHLIAAAPYMFEALTIADIDQIIEGIEHFCIGPSDPDGELQAIWQPYIDKLMALRTAIAKVEGR